MHMNISLWYAKLDRKTRIAMLCAGAVIALLAVILIGYMILVPEKVMVRYGEVVRDPVDGHVWSDNTQTIMVNPNEAGNYKVTYVDQLSEAHQKEKDDKAAADKQKQETLAKYPGLAAISAVMPVQQTTDLTTLQSNIDAAGSSLITGMETINQMNQVIATTTDYRNQIANTPVPPELEQDKQLLIKALDLYISAGNLVLKALETGNTTYATQANAQAQEANKILEDLFNKYQDILQNLQNLFPTFQ
jgi:hypothetical protein